jgi:hypothetical protein
MVGGTHVIRCGGWRRRPMMVIPGAKQPHSQVGCLDARNRSMVVRIGSENGGGLPQGGGRGKAVERNGSFGHRPLL